MEKSAKIGKWFGRNYELKITQNSNSKSHKKSPEEFGAFFVKLHL
jgi:hypothetical protein